MLGWIEDGAYRVTWYPTRDRDRKALLGRAAWGVYKVARKVRRLGTMHGHMGRAVVEQKRSWETNIECALNTPCGQFNEKVSKLQGVVHRAKEGLTYLKKSIQNASDLWLHVRHQYTSTDAVLVDFKRLLEGHIKWFVEKKRPRLWYQEVLPLYTRGWSQYSQALDLLQEAVSMHGVEEKDSSIINLSQRASSGSCKGSFSQSMFQQASSGLGEKSTKPWPSSCSRCVIRKLRQS